MELSELTRIWLIVCPLVFLGGIIDAVAGGGGLGGAGAALEGAVGPKGLVAVAEEPQTRHFIFVEQHDGWRLEGFMTCG